MKERAQFSSNRGAGMSNEMIGQWIGDLRGTDMGNVYAVIVDDNGRLRADFTVNVRDNITKGSGYIVVEGGVTSVELTSEVREGQDAPLGSAKVVFDTINSGHLAARWTTTTNHMGTVQLSRADTKTASPQPQSAPPKPIEIVAREGKLSNLRLYRSELEVIVAKMLDLVGGTNDVVVATTIDDRQIKQFSKDFFARKDLPQYVTSINLSVNDGRQPIMNVLVVNLSDRFESTFFVQSDNALWVSGSYAELESLFRRYTNPLFSFVQKHDLNSNALLLLAAIALLPDVPLLSRFLVLALFFVVAGVLLYVHKSLTSTRVYLPNDLSRGFFSKVVPSLASAITAAAILGAATWLYNTFPELVRWLGLR